MKKNNTFAIALRILFAATSASLVCYIITINLMAFSTEYIFGKILLQLVNLFILSVVIYPPIHQSGLRHHNMVDFGKDKQDKLRGLKAGLTAATPMLALTVMLIIPFEMPISKLMIYKQINTPFIVLLNLIFPKNEIPSISTQQFALTVLLQLYLPAITHAYYTLGYNRRGIINKIFYKKS